MYQIVYVSSATQTFSRTDLLELLAKSRVNNEKEEITGMLLFKDGNFMQIIEGTLEAIKILYNRIVLDPRHKGELILLEGPIEERQFANWSMGFRDLTNDDVSSVPGYSEFLNTPLTGKEFAGDPARCHKLLLAFKQNM